MFLPRPIPIPPSPAARTPFLPTLTGPGWATLAVGGGASSEKLGTICALGGKDNNGKEGGWDGSWDGSWDGGWDSGWDASWDGGG